MSYPPYPKKKRSGMWIIVLLVVVGVIIYANSKGIINLGSLNFGNFSMSGNQSGTACIQKVNSCGSIINQKYGSNVNVLNSTIAQNANDANQFLATWKSSSESASIATYNVSSYPITLVATRFDNTDGTKTPYVFICKSDGNLEEKTNSGLC